MIDTKLVRNVFLAVLFINVVYFVRVYQQEEIKTKHLALSHISSINYATDNQVEFDPKKPYHMLNTKEKISYLLDKVSKNQNNHYWLANTKIQHSKLKINPRDFLTPEDDSLKTWQNKPDLFYDPRFTLTVYLDELKTQLKAHNPKNEKTKDHLIKMPFSWADWVDLTMLNEELTKPNDQKLNCEWLQSNINKPTKYPDFCKNLMELSDEEVEEIGLSRDMLPGFIVKTSPMNKAPHKPVMLQGKAHLLAQQENPLSIIFLTKDGTYETQVSNKRQRIVHTDMFENYLDRRGINANHIEDTPEIELSPSTAFKSLQKTVKARPLDLHDDIYKMRQITRQKQVNASRELYLDKESFNYKQEQVDDQIQEYEIRLSLVEEAMTNELKYNPKVIQENKLNRHELNHYNGLKYANSLAVENEPTYYKLATLKKDKDNQDAGWHYEWRFFNGALRYLKDESWTVSQLEIREQIILDRLLRNWFRFAEEKGIISWIAHGPLLSWYWNGLMFPYDIDIDIQMPSSELNRLSKNYNMTLVVEDVTEGYGKFLIDCSTFLHHRDMATKDNHIDARFIDVDTGTYIDITGIGKNNETPPPEYDSYIKSKNQKGESVELYMDRRKHWLNFEKITPLRYSMISGVPVYVPNDILSMLNHEYSVGTKSYYFDGYYYVPVLRLWLQEERLLVLFKPEQYESSSDDTRHEKIINLIKQLGEEEKLKLLESNEETLMEYYLTHKFTTFHEVEKKFMLDHSLQSSIQDLSGNSEYHQLTSKFKMSNKPMRKSLYDYEYFERFEHMEDKTETPL
ncbi:uncharacterized protein SPAPADRAFT_145464 [Spathaspora passalidarum NRRL Y-27907]|uniref:LicD/FKTN/FKRP nucleotidyltransferase domain-containing protein n=1 Tax=Spathaspora passalidarum (strain NRRL Y-27907 / 11-Y1) TaxID=619300 RepID=G3AF91_SPAPN|nr:uncharacterized protein SPAPADRAFT_145464 [Spathaspora passalidarum NRRL Y-27907]EGW34880.1 hypothetical protein SPAPADRAFT_145464 [Spathaspora passalidarum NRRL Y-27907]